MAVARLLVAAALVSVVCSNATKRLSAPGTGGDSPGTVATGKWPQGDTTGFDPLVLLGGVEEDVGAGEIFSETSDIAVNRVKANDSQDVSANVSVVGEDESGSSSSESEEATVEGRTLSSVSTTETRTKNTGTQTGNDTYNTATASTVSGDSRESLETTTDESRGVGGDKFANATTESSLLASTDAPGASHRPGAADEGEGEVLGPGDEPGPPECRQLLKQPTPPFNMTYFTGTEGQDFASWYSEAEGGYRLRNAVRLHTITAVRETRPRTALCVSLVDTTSYTLPGGGKRPGGQDPDAVAWVTLHVRPEVPVGLLLVDSDCWRNEKNVAGCRPELRPLAPVPLLPLYRHSPLERAFWAGLRAPLLGFESDWVWRVNTMTKPAAPGRVQADWVALADLPELSSLEVQGNRWGRPPLLLPPLPRLAKIDLSYNCLQALPNGTLLQTPRLEELILGHNDVSDFPRDVARLPSLWLLDLTNPVGASPLRIADADIAALPAALDTLGLEYTRLSANATALLLRPRLRFLNLSGCALPDLGAPPSSATPSPPAPALTVEILDLSSNRLRSLPPALFARMKVLKMLLLRNNSLLSWPDGLFGKNILENLDLSDNLIANLSATSFSTLDHVGTLDLSGNQLEYLPPSLFSSMGSLNWLDLSGNKLTQLPDQLFGYRLNLTVINLSHNHLTTVPKTWNMKLKTLDLSHNELERFWNSDTKINSLDLSFNAITSLQATNVDRVNLSHNGLRYVDGALWEGLQPADQVDLGGNEFECCRFQDRKLLARAADHRVRNLGTGEPLTCSVSGVGAAAPKILLTTFVYEGTAECAPRSGGSVGEGAANGTRTTGQLGVQVALPLSLLTAAAVALAVLLYAYRFELTYVRHLFRMKQAGAAADEQRYKTCVYDAFICYSAHNFQWVVETLVPTLEEGGDGYRLCLHDRDFALGAGINSNIVASLEKSRKVIFVLSQDFIASKWCQWELEMANHKMFEEKRNYIILVELERLSRRLLPRHLRYLMDRTTYLEWPAGPAAADPRRLAACFRRLRHALGDSLSKRTGQPGARAATVLDA